MRPEQGFLLCGILILFLLVPSASAQDGQTAATAERAGVTPDNILYGLDVFFDEVIAFFTPDPLAKSELRLNIMQERMAEMEVMASRNKTTEAKTAELEVQKQMQNFEDSIEQVKVKDAPELQENIRIHAERLEAWKERLKDYDLPDYADAVAEAIVLLEETDNAIVNIPEDLGPESTFIISSMCKEAGATTVAECNEMISSGVLTAQIRVVPEGRADPHNCSGFYSDGKTKWCCEDSDSKYSPEWVEMIKNESIGNINMLNYYYRKGTVEYKIIDLESGEIEEGTETDSCDGSTLTEWFCPRALNMITRNERYSEEYECPYGCEDGKCIICNSDSVCNELEDCSCSDCEGKGDGCNYEFVCQNGECVYEAEGFELECADSDNGLDYFLQGNITASYVDNISTYYRYATDRCVDDSTLEEGLCGDNKIRVVRYLCPNGCQDGACIQ